MTAYLQARLFRTGYRYLNRRRASSFVDVNKNTSSPTRWSCNRKAFTAGNRKHSCHVFNNVNFGYNERIHHCVEISHHKHKLIPIFLDTTYVNLEQTKSSVIWTFKIILSKKQLESGKTSMEKQNNLAQICNSVMRNSGDDSFILAKILPFLIQVNYTGLPLPFL